MTLLSRLRAWLVRFGDATAVPPPPSEYFIVTIPGDMYPEIVYVDPPSNRSHHSP